MNTQSTGFNPLDPSTYLSALSTFGGYNAPVKAPPVNFSRATVRGGKTMDGTNFSSLRGATGIPPAGIPGADADWLSMDGIFGYKGADGVAHNGWGGAALGGMQAIGDMYSSMKQFGLAEDQFEEGKRQYDQNYQAQVKNYNTDLEDRQRARVASNSGGYQSVSDYMAKNRQV